MVHIVTGGINSGKTTRLLSLYREIGAGDGFILPKIYLEGNYAGQQIVRLTTGESRPFSLRKCFLPPDWNEQLSYDAYSFCREGLAFADSIAEDILGCGGFPAYIDEIGPLELGERGFFRLLSRLLAEDCPVYLTIRKKLLGAVIEKFKIKSYTIVEIVR